MKGLTIYIFLAQDESIESALLDVEADVANVLSCEYYTVKQDALEDATDDEEVLPVKITITVTRHD